MFKQLGILILAGAAGSAAQGVGSGGRQVRIGPRDFGAGSLRFLGAEPGRPGRVVVGAPYSADAVTEINQTLADGNRIHPTNTTRIYRDSQGRTRRDPALNALNAAAPGERHTTLCVWARPAEVRPAVGLEGDGRRGRA